MRLATAHMRTGMRLKNALKLYLQQEIDDLNDEFELEDERKILFPERIVIGEPPSLKIDSLFGLPQVFIRTSSSNNPQTDLVGHEDDNINISVSVILSDALNSTNEDLGLRCQGLANAICDVLVNYGRAKKSEDAGLWNINLNSSSTPSIAQWNEMVVARCDASLNATIRYTRDSVPTQVPDMELPDNFEPLSEAEPITVNNP
jgi:hypothetical protein